MGWALGGGDLSGSEPLRNFFFIQLQLCPRLLSCSKGEKTNMVKTINFTSSVAVLGVPIPGKLPHCQHFFMGQVTQKGFNTVLGGRNVFGSSSNHVFQDASQLGGAVQSQRKKSSFAIGLFPYQLVHLLLLKNHLLGFNMLNHL